MCVSVSQYYIIINKYTKYNKYSDWGFKIRIIYMKKICNCIIPKPENILINKYWLLAIEKNLKWHKK